MIVFSGCKINLGLSITARRNDGYHDIDTVMYPINGISDSIEILPANEYEFSSSGVTIDCHADKNLCTKAFRLMERYFGIGAIKIHLHKNIPLGAGLGGGSANATAVITGLNTLFGLGLDDNRMERLAAEIGSDTPFFVRNIPQYATGRGEILSPAEVNLTGKWIVLLKPPIGVSTAEAYAGITPRIPETPISEILNRPIAEWRNHLKNDFEESVFARLPLLGELKTTLYKAGSVYAAMSGSGSTIFGIFDKKPDICFKHLIFSGKL